MSVMKAKKMKKNIRITVKSDNFSLETDLPCKLFISHFY